MDHLKCRYKYSLPYALVTGKAAEQIASASNVTVKRWLNEAGSDVYAEEIVDNFAEVSWSNALAACTCCDGALRKEFSACMIQLVEECMLLLTSCMFHGVQKSFGNQLLQLVQEVFLHACCRQALWTNLFVRSSPEPH